jgi:hypothetical protein
VWTSAFMQQLQPMAWYWTPPEDNVLPLQTALWIKIPTAAD